MTPTDQQLKQSLAKMLPTELQWGEPLAWKQVNQNYGRLVLDTELLHLCWLVEETLTYDEKVSQLTKLEIEVTFAHSATWQQRTIALCKMKGIEIV